MAKKKSKKKKGTAKRSDEVSVKGRSKATVQSNEDKVVALLMDIHSEDVTLLSTLLATCDDLVKVRAAYDAIKG
jgi:hypothetical protein